MGQTVPGGYYRGVDGKLHDANGQPVQERSEASRAKEAKKTPATTEAEWSPTDPGPLGPLVPVSIEPPAQATEKAATGRKAKAKRGSRKGK